MTSEQLHALLQSGHFPYPAPSRELIETHISWVILAGDYVYKLKKPIDYSFLNFSTLERRRYYCHRELSLNRRLTTGMYLDVLPVRRAGASFRVGAGTGPIVDYALLMRRLDNSRQMDGLLRAGRVTRYHGWQLARRVAAFHRAAERVPGAEEAPALYADFADLESVISCIEEKLGREAAAEVRRAIDFVAAFLDRHRRHLRRRHQRGWVIDGHGDLHSKNILLLDEPVIFDCIEFSDAFRTLDVLNEIAFCCMDLDYYGHPHLARAFRTDYLNRVPAVETPLDWDLFYYYRLYRANVRLKVNCLRARQPGPEVDADQIEPAIRDYYGLFRRYFRRLMGRNPSLVKSNGQLI